MLDFLFTPHKHYFNPFVNIFNPLEEDRGETFRTQSLRKRIFATVLVLWGMPGLPIQDVLPSRSGVLDYLTVIPVLTRALLEVIKSSRAPQWAKSLAYVGLALFVLPAIALTIVNTIVAALTTLILSPLIAFMQFCIKKKNKYDLGVKMRAEERDYLDEPEAEPCCTQKSITSLARVAEPKPKVDLPVKPVKEIPLPAPIILREPVDEDFRPALPPAGRLEGKTNSSGWPSM